MKTQLLVITSTGEQVLNSWMWGLHDALLEEGLYAFRVPTDPVSGDLAPQVYEAIRRAHCVADICEGLKQYAV